MKYFINDRSVKYQVFLVPKLKEKNSLSQRGAFFHLKFLENLALLGANSILVLRNRMTIKKEPYINLSAFPVKCAHVLKISQWQQEISSTLTSEMHFKIAYKMDTEFFQHK